MPLIYVLASYAPYEGYNEPVGAYTTLRRAKRELAKWELEEPGGYSEKQIIRVPIDQKPST